MRESMNLRDGTALGCIGRCKVCGKAIQLRRVWSDLTTEEDRWLHFRWADHVAELR